jgi:pantoate--beta-alanine ligase
LNLASLQVARDNAQLKQLLADASSRNLSLGLVPTMAALHAGHAALIRRARSENDLVAVSIFVNPLQFDRKSDLAAYPRELDQDLALCSQLEVDVVYTPSVADLYPQPQLAFVEVPELEKHLCGRFRPGHFRGVATVVLKLLNLFAPERAYFGEKDAQQLAIIRRMVEDLNVPVDILPVATVREADGLALSSRNVRLSPAERSIAPRLYAALKSAADRFTAGETSVQPVCAHAPAPLLSEPEVKLEYFEVCDPRPHTPLDRVSSDALVAAALFLGETRLIDNLLWHK